MIKKCFRLLGVLGILPFFSAFAQTAYTPPLTPKDTTVSLAKETVVFLDSLNFVKKLITDDENPNELEKALQTSLHLLKSAEQKKDSIAVEKITFFMGELFYKSNNYDKALTYYLKSKAFSRKNISDSDSLFYLNRQLLIGVMYAKNELLDSAVSYYKRIIKTPLSKQKKIELIKIKALNNLSGVQYKQGDLLQAEINVLDALHLQKKYQDTLAIAQAQNNLASIYLSQKRYKDAKKELLEVLDLLKNKKDKKSLEFKEVIYDNLSWALFKLKDYKAYTYHEKSFLIRDSLRNDEIGLYLAKLDAKYNAETIKKQEEVKTERERSKRIAAQNINNLLIIISLSILLGSWLVYRYLKLRQKNLQLELSRNQLIQKNRLEQIQNENREKILNATLDGKESERKMIAETLHHSVSSLLSSASLHLQASKMLLKDNVPEEIHKAQKILNEASEKIRNLSHSLVSSVLLKFGLAYAVQDLCEKYTNSSLNFFCKCDDIGRFDSEFEIKINSIIDELLNNIIKHSQAQNAEIHIKQKNNKLEIHILDDGKGFDVAKGIDKEGLGLRQIEARIRKMRGEFRINSSKGEGTSIFISVPIPKHDKSSG